MASWLLGVILCYPFFWVSEVLAGAWKAMLVGLSCLMISMFVRCLRPSVEFCTNFALYLFFSKFDEEYSIGLQSTMLSL